MKIQSPLALKKNFGFSKVNVGSRLALGFVGVMILFLIATGFVLLTLSSYQAQLEVTHTLDKMAVNSQDLYASLRAEAKDFADILLREDISLEPLLLADITRTNQLVATLSKSPLDQRAREQLDLFSTQHTSLEKIYRKALDTIKNPYRFGSPFALALNSWVVDVQQALQQAEKSSSTLTEMLTQKAEAQVGEANSEVSQRQVWVIGGLLVAFVLGSVISLTTTRTQINHTLKMKKALLELEDAHAEIDRKQRAGEAVSQEVLGLAAELKSTSSQQVEGSNEQARVIVEINASVSELSATAAQIAQMAEQVSLATRSTSQDSQQIEETATHSVSQSEKGIEAIKRTIEVSQEVGELYQQLLDIMTELTDRANQTTVILDLLSTVASETHLLSLNAAIEAAGAGEAGQRFMVVANEVKDLASRSGQASKQVVGIVSGIGEVVGQAVQCAKEGFTKAGQMREVVEEAGRIIEEMGQISGQSLEQARSITSAANHSQDLTETIREAMFQQSQASALVRETLAGFTTITQQGAEGTKLVSWTAHNLEKVSLALKTTLAA